jgi:MoxR-like ATPase
MSGGAGSSRPLEPIDRRCLEERLARIVERRIPGRILDSAEMRYLSGLAANYFLLLADVYDGPTIDRILHQEAGATLQELRSLWERASSDEIDRVRQALRRIRSVPDDVRLIGEKCLYDVGVFGKREHGAWDLHDLGVASYQRASDILEELGRDRRLRQFFRDDRLGGRRIEDEVTFLRRCARSFDDYADVLRRLDLFADARGGAPPRPADDDLLLAGDSLMPAEEEGPSARASLGAALQPAERHALEPIQLEEEDPELAHLEGPDRLSYLERLLLFSSLDIEALRRRLKEVVVDQTEAIDCICDDFSLFATGTQARNKPLSYFFIGPTGVGKNHLVEQLAVAVEALWGREVPLLLIEGPSYTYPSDINELRGSTRGFIRSDEEGILTEFHHRASAAPFSIILVDEVEKAHPQLRKFFLSLMDRGTTTDNRGQQLNFSSTMLVYTSNLGYSRLQQAADPIGFAGGDAREEYRRCELLSDLKRELSPEFVNRLRIVHFQPLSAGSISRIFDLELERIAQRYLRYQNLVLTVTASARQALLARGYSPEYGARFLGRVLNEVCNIQVSKKIRGDSQVRGDESDRADLLSYIQEARREERTPDFEMLQRRVLARARTRLPYRRVTIDHQDGRFVYRTS